MSLYKHQLLMGLGMSINCQYCSPVF